MLLIEQRRDKRAKMTCNRIGGAASTLSYVCSMIFTLRAEAPSKERRAMFGARSVNTQQISSIVYNGT